MMRHQTLTPPPNLEPLLERLAVLAKEMREAGYPDLAVHVLTVYVRITRESAAAAES